jgi:hypothetical protein
LLGKKIDNYGSARGRILDMDRKRSYISSYYDGSQSQISLRHEEESSSSYKKGNKNLLTVG